MTSPSAHAPAPSTEESRPATKGFETSPVNLQRIVLIFLRRAAPRRRGLKQTNLSFLRTVDFAEESRPATKGFETSIRALGRISSARLRRAAPRRRGLKPGCPERVVDDALF